MTREMNEKRRPGLGRAYAVLSAVNPLLYLATYFLLIPLFAISYCGLAASHEEQDFYASYARREPSALADKAVVERNLRAALLHALDANLPAHRDWAVDRDHFDAYGLNLPTEGEPSQGGTATFTVYLFAQHLESGHVLGSAGPSELTMDLHKSAFGGRPWTICHSTSPPQSALQARYGFAFDLLLTPPPPWQPGSSICWSADAEVKFERLLAGWRGDPRAVSNVFGRMVYFSATTITTTGFGDIIPLSNLARLLAGLESVLGWVVAGLFLNAAAWLAGKSASA